MSNKLELLSLSCACCGAKLEDFIGKDEVKCDFCDNTTRVLRPVSIKATANLASDKVDKFANLVQIMERSMVAENYKEAYDYCNKALELDPSCGTVWENKAICCFWLRSDNNIIESQAKEILTYLNAAKTNDPESKTFYETAKDLSFNLYFAAYYRYILVTPDLPDDKGNYTSYSFDALKTIISYLNMMEISFDLHPTELYLNPGIRELTNLEKVHWITKDKKTNELTNAVDINKLGFNPVKSREKYISKVTKLNPEYVEPEFPKPEGCFIATAVAGDYNHPTVVDLRLFRDNWLMKRDWGVQFTNWYYTHGPKAARTIENSIILRKLCYLLVIKPLHLITNKLK